jgi:hypothetical protein
MKVLIFLYVICAANGAVAVNFERVVGGPDLDRGVFVEPTKDGGYVVVGVTRNTDGGDEDVYLVRLNAAGEVLWTHTYGGDDEDNGWCVREVEDGYVIAGYTKSFGAGGYDGYLIRTDAKGEVRWSRLYGGQTDDRCWGLVVTADGGHALIGETVVAETDARDVWLIRTNAKGDERWSRTYGGNADDRGFAIVQAADDGFVLVGQTYSEGAGDRDVYVIKTDSTGEKVWSRTFGGTASDVGHGVDVAADSNFVVFGYTTSFARSGDDPYLIKIDAAGDTLWTRVLDFPGVSHSITGAQGALGGLFLVGFTHDPMSKATAALLIHTDDDGRAAWSKQFLPTNTGQSFGYTVRATADGGCIFTGHTTERSAGELDLFVIKLDIEGQ